MTGGAEFGRRGEGIAARHLCGLGFTILHRNFRFHRNEIDLVARRGPLVVFVEVKARAGSEFGHPLEAVTRAKRREIARVARAWIQKHGAPGEEYRFDAIAVTLGPRGIPQVEHVEDAWRVGE
ncbi:MAG: YraN family protein [Gemmatimonadetes bacterium]|nr:YraN family protein [Gemmatimonadota bacterium]